VTIHTSRALGEPPELEPPALTIALSVDIPPNLPQTLGFGRMGGGDPCLRIVGDSVWRATRTPLGVATEHVSRGPDRSIRIDAWGAGAPWLIEHGPQLCGMSDDPSAFQPDQPLLKLLTRLHPGLRMGRSEAVFETAMLVTLEQRVVTREAWASWRLFVRALGEPAPGPFPGLWVPPAAERIVRTPYHVFHRFGVERRRADVIRRLGVVARRLEETASMTCEAAYQRLRAISGVGPWTAARIGLIALGDPDAVPVGDLHLPHLVASALAGERRGSDERMLELLEPFRGHRGRAIRLIMAGAHAPRPLR
jgi:3-methyladenine DNA glycosylase/8-oxoguanine DNA glycosylase